mgnify:CR=1 FL=1
MGEGELMGALIKGSPVAVAILALGFAVWKWILPMMKELRSIDQQAEAARESARVARDAAWQASLREIGQQHREATAVAVGGFKEALDRHDRAMDRYAQQHQALAADVTAVKIDISSMRTDLHGIVSKFATGEIPVVSPPKKG